MPEGAGADRSLAEHRRRAKHAIDLAIESSRAEPWRIGASDEANELAQADADNLRSIVIVLIERTIPEATAADRVRRVLGVSAISSGIDDQYIATRLLGTLGNRRAAWTRNDALILLRLVTGALERHGPSDEWRIASIIAQPIAAAERAVRDGGLGELDEPIRALAARLATFSQYSLAKAALARNRLLALLGDGAPVADLSVVSDGDTWGASWMGRAGTMTSGQRALLGHLPSVASVSPTLAWRKVVTELVRAQGAGPILRQMLAEAPASRNVNPPRVYEFEGRTLSLEQPRLVDANALILRGAIWAAVELDEPWVAEALTDVALHFGTSGRSDNVARDERLANAAAAALGTMTGAPAIAGLGRLKAKVTNRNVSKQVAKALDAAAARAGISPSELLELAVPTVGLDHDGRREIRVGDHIARLAIDGDDATLTWQAPSGVETARPPAAIATTEKAAIVSAKEAQKELRRAVAVERGRLEELFVEGRDWAYEDWRARYLDHPLTRRLADRLIWSIGDDEPREGIPVGDELVDVDGASFRPAADTRVHLWHPIDAPEDTISRWRTLILERQIRQPFKQAFRELYVLTPAEEETEFYSNRFAAHILAYPQARALMTARRWGSNFLGPYDGGFQGLAKRVFPVQGLRAEFWHDAIEPERMAEVTHCTTDQVRFIRLQPVEELIRLRSVPPIVFSEAMRDIDLFVSVTSIGADRNWQDGGQNRDPRFDGYWGNVWEMPLTPTAKVRRDVLERMLPGLAVADRLTLLDRWLEVRGDLRTYRIHLGSGNILMAPSDTYLCIIPSRGGATDRLFLPFDDDLTLSAILSKAFLLAADRTISDRMILEQIRRARPARPGDGAVAG